MGIRIRISQNMISSIKITIFGLLGQTIAQDLIQLSKSRFEDRLKRYRDLSQMANRLWRERGETEKFDEDIFFTYGCHCFLDQNQFGERLKLGKGAPVDEIDRACKKYKFCQKCVQDKHGDTCTHDFYRYNWRWGRKSEQLEILSPSGSCEREMGECDKKFVYDIFEARQEFDNAFHNKLSFFDPTDKENCSAEARPRSRFAPISEEFQCCGGYNGPYQWISTSRQQCCNIGRVNYVSSWRVLEISETSKLT